MNKRHYEHTLPNIRGSLSNTYHEPSICNKRTAGSHEDAHAGNEKKKDGGTRTCRQVPATGDDRAGTHLHPVEPDSGNQPPSRQEQAAGQTVQ